MGGDPTRVDDAIGSASRKNERLKQSNVETINLNTRCYNSAFPLTVKYYLWVFSPHIFIPSHADTRCAGNKLEGVDVSK